MDFTDFLRALFALVLTLGLIGLAAVALRRYGPEALGRFAGPKKDRRLAVVEPGVVNAKLTRAAAGVRHHVAVSVCAARRESRSRPSS